MADLFNKKLAEIMGKMDEKVLKTRLNAAIEMLKKGETEDLAKKLNKMDKNELLEKLNELDASKLQDLNIDKDEIKKNVDSADFDKLSKLIGQNGNEIVEKIKSLLEGK